MVTRPLFPSDWGGVACETRADYKCMYMYTMGHDSYHTCMNFGCVQIEGKAISATKLTVKPPASLGATQTNLLQNSPDGFSRSILIVLRIF